MSDRDEVTTMLCRPSLTRWPIWLALLLGGCSGVGGRVAAPAWDPAGLADNALRLLDTNGDGAIDHQELGAAPGLAAGAGRIDTDGNGRLTAREIAIRLEQYQEYGLGLTSQMFRVTWNGSALPDAEVRFVPEPFLDGMIEPAQGTTDSNGVVVPEAGVAGVPGALRAGYYRIEIRSSNVAIPAEYNSATTLGFEVTGAHDEEPPPGTVELTLEG